MLTTQNPKTRDVVTRRPPLLPSENDNNHDEDEVLQNKKPKSRVVSSRYMSSPSISATISSSSSSRTYASPLLPRNSTTNSNTTPSLSTKSSVSIDRQRPAAARALAPDLNSKKSNPAATKLLVTSTRSLSVSFQGESFSLPTSKNRAAAPSSPNLRKETPERRKSNNTGTPLSKPENFVVSSADPYRWPATNRKTMVNPLSRSLNYSGSNGGYGNAVRALQQSSVINARLIHDMGNSSEYLKTAETGSDLENSNDSDNVPSDSTTGLKESSASSHNVPRGGVVSARFWQETNSQLRRLRDPGSSTSLISKQIAPQKLTSSTSVGPTMASPRRVGIRHVGSSPSRIRNSVSTINNSFTEAPSVLSFGVDVRRGKVGDDRIDDAHLLILLYNRHMQWLFVNARSESLSVVQKHSAEKNLWNVWITISGLRDNIIRRRHRLQLLKQKLKLASILKGQMTYLEDWASSDKDHSTSLRGVVEALKAATIRLPLVGGATANVQSLKDAIGSAANVMEATASSIQSLLPKVEEMSCLATELAKVTTNERALLEQYREAISMLEAMQVKESNLRTHIIQHNQ